jgi:hypothetical protein
MEKVIKLINRGLKMIGERKSKKGKRVGGYGRSSKYNIRGG